MPATANHTQSSAGVLLDLRDSLDSAQADCTLLLQRFGSAGIFVQSSQLAEVLCSLADAKQKLAEVAL